jgi:hypothetical protein
VLVDERDDTYCFTRSRAFPPRTAIFHFTVSISIELSHTIAIIPLPVCWQRQPTAHRSPHYHHYLLPPLT